ncbi:MAG: SUMO ligase siz1 [Pycnora praestabilis]|nr:MAG: SUMO ligase siz1 [Pycnora praestabilis]
MASGAQILDPQLPIRNVKQLIVANLKTVCRAEGLPPSGVKLTLQDRIIKLLVEIQEHARKHDIDKFNRLSNLIKNPNAIQPPMNSGYGQNSSASPLTSSHHSMANASGRLPGSGPPLPRQPQSSSRLTFKESPFYTILEPLTPILDCPAMPQNRHTVTSKLIFDVDVAHKLQNDMTLKAMVYCAAETGLPAYTKADVAFPHQVEIKVNLDEVKSNLRGLKNKPGSTRPADVTSLLRKRANYENSVVMTYALTQKKFSLVVNLVYQHPVEELVNRLKSGKNISKEQVVREMISKAQDADIVATSTVMSLKCPLSTLRMDLPCRSIEQAPTWTCPVCNKVIVFEALQVDQYVNEILKSTTRSVEQVIIEPDGKWSQNSQPASPPRPNGASLSNSDDDDLVEIREIKDTRVASLKNESTPAPTSSLRTPFSSSREHSAALAPPRSANGKRPIEQVIDLTFSDDDDDDDPPRPAKRQVGYKHDSSMTESRNDYHTSSDSSRTNGINFRIPKPSSLETPDSPDSPVFNYQGYDRII